MINILITLTFLSVFQYFPPPYTFLSAVLNIPRHFFHSSGLPKRPLISLVSIIESVNRIKSHFEVPSIMRRALRKNGHGTKRANLLHDACLEFIGQLLTVLIIA